MKESERKTFSSMERKSTAREYKMQEKVKQALDEIRPSLAADGGDVELVEITPDGVVKVRLKGACSGCPMAQITLKQGIERYLMQKIPELKGVESVSH